MRQKFKDMENIQFIFPSEEELKTNDFSIEEIKSEKASGNFKSYKVNNYSELVVLTAQLSFLNPKHFILYRGQSESFTNQQGCLSFLPTIYRKSGNEILTDEELKERFKKLAGEVEKIRTMDVFKNISKSKQWEKKSPIIAESIIQHYNSKEIPTPWLDLTQSLRVAYSFAAQSHDNNSDVFIYVFGMPNPTQTIFTEKKSGITIIRLSSLCHPKALRPFLQEGYLVSTPKINTCEKIETCNFNKRLIAEIRIPYENITNKQYFHRIPEDSLLANRLDVFYQNQLA